MMKQCIQRLNNLLNPIMVKELRQAMRSRFIVILLNLFLGAQFLFVLLYFLDAQTQIISNGQTLFISLSVLLIGASIACVPAYTVHQLSEELRNDDMIFSTSMRPFQVVWGKFSSGVVMSALFFSASAPFLTLTYMMRGLDLQTIFWTIFFGYISVQVLNGLAILLGTLKLSVIFQSIIALVFGYFVIVSIDYFSMFSPFSGSSFYADSWTDAFYVIAITLLISFWVVGTLLFWGAARIAPETSNRMVGLRIFQTICFFAVLAIFWGIGLYGWQGGSSSEPLLIIRTGEVIAMIFVAIHAQIGICERTRFSRRMIHAIPHSILKHMAAYPFFTSVYSALTWSFCLFGIFVASDFLAWRIMEYGHQRLFAEPQIQFWGLVLFFIAYGTAAFILKEIFNGIRNLKSRQMSSANPIQNEDIKIPVKQLGGGQVLGIETILIFLGMALPLLGYYWLFGLSPDQLDNNSGAFALNIFTYMDEYSNSSRRYDDNTFAPYLLGTLSLCYWAFVIVRDFLAYMKRYPQ